MENYTVETTVLVIKANYIGIFVRQLDPNNWYGWAINVEDKAMSWISQFAGNLEEITKNPIDLDIAKKYTLKVIVADENLKDMLMAN